MIDSGVKISGYIRPIGENDSYPTHLDIFGKGGIHSAIDINARNLITELRRSLGMFAYTASDNSMYGLFDGLTNDNWVKLFEYKDHRLNFNIGCDEDYILVGTKEQITKPSPALIDLRLEILGLRQNIGKFRKDQRELHALPEDMLWIGSDKKIAVPHKTIAVDNMPQIAAAQFPEPTGLLTTSIPNPSFNPLSGTDWLLSGPWLPQIFAGSPSILDPTLKKTVTSSSLAMTQIKVAQSIKRIDNSSFIVKSRNISFTWDNPAIYLLPPEIRALYDLESTHTLENAQALEEMGAGLVYNNAEGILSRASLTNNHIWIGARVGDQDNVLTEIEYKAAPDNAAYILQTPSAELTNAQALNELGGGMLKTKALSNGVISIASGGGTPSIDDYVDPFTLQTNIAETKVFASAEAAAAEIAAVASSTAYFHLQMLPYVPLLGSIGTQITAAIGVVGAVAAVAKSTADEAIILIDNLEVTLEGEAYGTGKIKNAIQTKVGFSFFSKADIPLNPHLGMLLFVEN
jgi:hypothetical protein